MMLLSFAYAKLVILWELKGTTINLNTFTDFYGEDYKFKAEGRDFFVAAALTRYD